MTTQEATRAADIPNRPLDSVLSRLADRLGAQMRSSTVFGTPVERDGVTVIPVAAVRLGFGGGSGGDPARDQSGEGGGGGGAASPIGYIELKDGNSRFVPVVHPARMAALATAAILAGMLIVRR